MQPPLTFAAIAHEIDGRVDLNMIHVVQAVRDTVLRAKVATKPAAYVAAVIVRKPETWLHTSIPQAPGSYEAQEAEPLFAPLSSRDARAAQSALCQMGEHDWGPDVWPEVDRAYCLTCNVSRRNVDPVFRDLQDEHDRFKFGSEVNL